MKETLTENRPTLEKTLKEISEQLMKMNEKIDKKHDESVEPKEENKTSQPEAIISPRLKRNTDLQSSLNHSDDDL